MALQFIWSPIEKEILGFGFTSGNTADYPRRLLKRMLGKVQGLCLGDKGCNTALGKDFFDEGLKIMIRSERRARSKLMLLDELDMLLKHPLIESINTIFTPVLNPEHSGHRNADNALTHMIPAICAYCLC